MGCILKGSHSFICTSRVHPLTYNIYRYSIYDPCNQCALSNIPQRLTSKSMCTEGFEAIEMLPLCDCFDCPVQSRPYLFSIVRQGRTAGPIFTLYGSNDMIPCKHGRFILGVRTITDVLCGNMTPKLPKWAWIRNFKPKHRNIKIAISEKLRIRSRPNLRIRLRPTIVLRGWSNITQIKSNRAAGRHLKTKISATVKSTARPSRLVGVLYDISWEKICWWLSITIT